MPYRELLIAGVALPFVYFTGQIAAFALNPDHDIARQPPSELGCCGADFPMVANVGFALTGLAAILGSIGLYGGLRRIGGHWVLAAISGLALALFGVAMTMNGVFPLPASLHSGLGFYPAMLAALLFGAFALEDMDADRWIVLAGFAATGVIALLFHGMGAVMTDANAGLFARGLALAAFASVAYLCWAVRYGMQEITHKVGYLG